MRSLLSGFRGRHHEVRLHDRLGGVGVAVVDDDTVLQPDDALCLPGGDVRPVCKALNEAFGGRGGGKPGFCQGSLACTDFADVQNFLVNYHE